MNDTNTKIREGVMQRIHQGEANMRPRWYFFLLSGLTALGVLIALLALLFAVSLMLFFLRESGALYLSDLGGRGWWDLARSLPVSILVLLLLFVVLLEVLVRRYTFVYKKPLVVSILSIIALVFFGGFALAEMPLHGHLAALARHGTLPSPLDLLYRPPFTMHADDVYPGTIVALVDGGIVLSERGVGTTTILVSSRTLVPEGTRLSVGDRIVVIGDTDASGSIHAFGIRPMRPEPGMR